MGPSATDEDCGTKSKGKGRRGGKRKADESEAKPVAKKAEAKKEG